MQVMRYILKGSRDLIPRLLKSSVEMLQQCLLVSKAGCLMEGCPTLLEHVCMGNGG